MGPAPLNGLLSATGILLYPLGASGFRWRVRQLSRCPMVCAVGSRLPLLPPLRLFAAFRVHCFYRPLHLALGQVPSRWTRGSKAVRALRTSRGRLREDISSGSSFAVGPTYSRPTSTGGLSAAISSELGLPRISLLVHGLDLVVLLRGFVGRVCLWLSAARH